MVATSYNDELRTRQFTFTRHIGFLINFCYSAENDFQLTGGDWYRSPEMQKIYFEKGLSKTLDGNHPKRLAWDVNFFKDGYLLFSDKSRKDTDFNLVKPIGDYWQTLHKSNRWGGYFTTILDIGHFEHNF